MYRRRFLQQMLAGVVTVGGVGLVGCGGGGGSDDKNITIRPGGTGRLQDVAFSPASGSSYIFRTTNFLIRWATGAAPQEFTVSLQRYQEPNDDSRRRIDAQKITLSDYGADGWRVRRKDNFNLDDKGIYYLQLSAPGGEIVRAAYIVADGRAVSRAFDTGGNGTLDGIQISPPPGRVFIPRDTTFVVTWPAGNEAPPRLGIDIYRYEERFGESKNNIELSRPGNGEPLTRYAVKRREGDLERSGVYILRVTNDAGDTRDYVYIVEDA